MNTENSPPAEPVWIRGPRLRQRWNLPNSTFYDKLKAGLIPAPEYPFGPARPFWRMDVIERFEQSKKVAA